MGRLQSFDGNGESMDRQELLNLLVEDDLDTKTVLDLIGNESIIIHLHDQGYSIITPTAMSGWSHSKKAV